ncbi:prenyltransferase/squalene oxidase repeat-containing protein [Archangium sp.]|uniref:prenyltransferase/squalene oxidase repeat-containing protein n=1 Tax=Archangium sp. TaxID=1872627 RepID=UPI002D3FBBB5|nr:prenyltransferase/squalene oxidase repeat-containing protein [Archangium sp.]HYO58565.1 prenyltransferase/squalene oxidase repeat-containing protein [Archangium sp.]
MAPENKTSMDAAISAALGFLLKAQDDRGAWKDFLLPAGHSDVWVTAFVGDVLAGMHEPEARRAADAAWKFLEGVAAPEGGWSYNDRVPGDGDSTLWGLRLAEALGQEGSDRARAARDFLERHLREDGGLTTYASPDPVRNYIGLPPVVPFKGWTQSHICVTAAGANLTSYRERLREYLVQKQAGDGRWPAYWWFEDEYATAEAVTALAGAGRRATDCESGIASRLERAAQWALGRAARWMDTPGIRPPTFALAHGLRVVARATPSEQVADVLSQGVARLREWQTPGGSWPASTRLRVPRPDVTVPNPQAEWTLWAGLPPGPLSPAVILKHTFTNYSLDHFAVYTTATVLKALNEVRSLQA